MLPAVCPRPVAARLALTIAVGVLGAGTAAGVGEPLAAQKPAKVLVQTGQLTAEGAGSIRIEGSIVAFGQASAPATLVVVDGGGGNTRVTVGSKQRKLKRRASVTIVVPAAGRLYVEGSKASLRLSSAGSMRLSAAVKGKGWFEGAGNFLLNAGQPVAWQGAAVAVDLLPAAQRNRGTATVTTPPPAPSVLTPSTTTTTAKTTTAPPPAEAPPTLVTTAPPKGG